MLRRGIGSPIVAALLVVLLAAAAPAVAGCRSSTPAEDETEPAVTPGKAETEPGLAPGEAGTEGTPETTPEPGQLRIKVIDVRACAAPRNYEWRDPFANPAVSAFAYPQFDVSRGGSVVVGQGSVVIQVFVTEPVLPQDVDKALSTSETPSATTEWSRGWWYPPGSWERPFEFHGLSRELTFSADKPGPFRLAVAGSLPLGPGTTLGEDVEVTVARAREPLVSLEGVERPHIAFAAPSGAVHPFAPCERGSDVRRFSLPPGTWRFRATFSEPMAGSGTSPNYPLPEHLLEVKRDLGQGEVGVTAEWQDSTHLVVTVTASDDARGLVGVFFDGLEAASGSRVGAQGGLDLEFAPSVILRGLLVGQGSGRPVEWPVPVDVTHGVVAPGGRHALVWETVSMSDDLDGYHACHPWLVDLQTGGMRPIDFPVGPDTPYAGWRDARTLFLSCGDGLYRLEVNDGEPADAVGSTALHPVAVPLADVYLNGFGISPDGETIALAADYWNLLLIDSESLKVTTEAAGVFPEGLFYVPQSDVWWSLPITWIPGRSAIALERIRHFGQLAFSVPSGRPEETVFSGPGGRNVAGVIAWSPDGQTVLAADPGLCLVTATTETPLVPDWRPGPYMWSLPSGAFSPSGAYVTVREYGGEVQVYRVATGSLEATFDGRLLDWSREEDRVWVIEVAEQR